MISILHGNKISSGIEAGVLKVILLAIGRPMLIPLPAVSCTQSAITKRCLKKRRLGLGRDWHKQAWSITLLMRPNVALEHKNCRVLESLIFASSNLCGGVL